MLETELDNKERDNNESAGSGEAAADQEPPASRRAPAVPATAGPASQPAGPVTPPPVPAATFQPPQVIFQPPAVAPAPAEDEDDGSGHETDADDEGAGGSRRRRRRGGRGRGKTADGGEGGPEPHGPESAAETGGRTAGGAGAPHSQRAAAEEPGAAAPDGAGTGPEAPRATRSRKRGGDREPPAPEEAASEGAANGAPRGESAAPADGQAAGGTTRTRRSRTTRGTGGKEQGAEPATAQAELAGEHADGSDADDGEGESAATRRRRRRRRRGAGEAEPVPAGPDDPPNTVVHVREPRAASTADRDEVQSVKGSTRLEAKKQRRREGRDSGRRRPPVLSESEFLARREAVQRVMLVRQKGERTQIAVLEDGVLVEHYVDRATHQSMAGNIYLGKVQNVLPSMEAAFVDVGKGRNAVLYAGEINFDASGLEGQPKRIEMVLKSGQSVLVQVTKDPVGHKGARLTNQVSLPGRYLVYVPGASMTGISRKLPATERTRLKQILKKVTPENGGVIVRTAAEGTGEEELARDVARLAAQWENIERKASSASPPELLYSEPDLTIRVVRDIFNEDFSELVVAGDDGWDTVNEYVRYVAPHLAERLRRWDGDTDVFASYRIDEQLAKALERKVWLPSGGSLVIDRTEAMTVIDVNTGKFTGQGGNLEETVTRNNLEAAEEIVRQLRLRDIGGIIVIDFIDMVLESNRELVLRRMLECLARDRTKHQVAEVTSLGLVQMTRKRVGSGLLEAFSEPCECCNGRGLHVSLDLLDAPGGKRAQPGRGGGRSDAKGQDDASQSEAKHTGDVKGRGARGHGDTKEQARSGAGENGKRHGAEPAAAGGHQSNGGAAGKSGAGDGGADGGAGGDNGTHGRQRAGARADSADTGQGAGAAVAQEGRESAPPAEDKPPGRRRRRRQAGAGGDGGADAAAETSGTDMPAAAAAPPSGGDPAHSAEPGSGPGPSGPPAAQPPPEPQASPVPAAVPAVPPAAAPPVVTRPLVTRPAGPPGAVPVTAVPPAAPPPAEASTAVPPATQ